MNDELSERSIFPQAACGNSYPSASTECVPGLPQTVLPTSRFDSIGHTSSARWFARRQKCDAGDGIPRSEYVPQ